MDSSATCVHLVGASTKTILVHKYHIGFVCKNGITSLVSVALDGLITSLATAQALQKECRDLEITIDESNRHSVV